MESSSPSLLFFVRWIFFQRWHVISFFDPCHFFRRKGSINHMRAYKIYATTASFFALSALVWLTSARATPDSDTWHLDGPHSAAQFSIRHLGISTVRGTFTKLSGDVTYAPADVSKSSVNVTIDASSVDTRVEKRDNDLRSDHFFDVAKYPTITFKSKRVAAAGSGKLTIVGDLTIHGVTKEVTLDVTGPTPPIKNPMGPGQRMGASASTKINREDFGMNYMTGMIGDEVEIQIDVELVK
jgi:polyisoprenoid-binding protein YceI